MTKIALSAEYMPLVRSGEKTQTIRKGRRDYPLGPAVLEASGDTEEIQITRLVYARLSSITEEEARADGFDSVGALRDALTKFYPDIGDDTEVTIVQWKRKEDDS